MASLCLQNFYADYYHPSNARFWFYGDDPGGWLVAALLFDDCMSCLPTGLLLTDCIAAC